MVSEQPEQEEADGWSKSAIDVHANRGMCSSGCRADVLQGWPIKTLVPVHSSTLSGLSMSKMFVCYIMGISRSVLPCD